MTAEIQQAVLEIAAGTEAIRQPDIVPVDPAGTLMPKQESASIGRRGRVFQWVIPALLAGAMGLGLALYNQHEQSVNQEVMSLQQQAKKEALAGHYSEAVKLLQKAQDKRPHYDALTRDQELAAKAAQLQTQLAGASEQLKAQKLDEGEKALTKISDTIGGREEPLFAPLQKELESNQVTLTVLRVKSELDKLTTVDALADKLDTISGLSGKEAAAVKSQIISKIVGLSYSSAEEKLRKKDFSGALEEVDNGLSYDTSNKKLTAYRTQIEQAKQEFEQAEAERIQLAQQKAAEEDLNNRTAAVSVSNVEAVLDNYGDLMISGTAVNSATRPIYSISVSLELYSSSTGAYLGTVYADVSPFRLEPGESGSFSTWYYGVYEQATVSAVNASWYLE
ncbi:FxLYD domain-containing protein [Paenibacillus pinistramenti]|uniref:FxLYD domain-containing protein n=1 Tax=Paenibacillus pinistramenti TaxID=1768003 RepID=UPI001EF06F48|nr:FxLYD domain-containing protein [Paenibacillus pinistramenti]